MLGDVRTNKCSFKMNMTFVTILAALLAHYFPSDEPNCDAILKSVFRISDIGSINKFPRCSRCE